MLNCVICDDDAAVVQKILSAPFLVKTTAAEIFLSIRIPEVCLRILWSISRLILRYSILKCRIMTA